MVAPIMSWATSYRHSGSPESVEVAGGHRPSDLSKVTGAKVPYQKIVTNMLVSDNFMVYQYRIKTILLQLFAHRENSEGFSIMTFEVNIVAKQKQAYL